MPTVLVVDDVPTNRLILERMLRKFDLQIVMATNGAEALEQIVAVPPDLILLDIMMPVMDGFEVLRILNERATVFSIPIVVVSALNDIESVARCIALGASDFLFKPVNPVLLEARVQSSLKQKALYDREQAAYQALEAANRAKSEFVAIVAHELRNPLTALRGYADLLAQATFGPVNEQQEQTLKSISRISQAMARMVSDLSDISRIESGQIALDRRTHQLGALVNVALYALEQQIKAKQQIFRLMIDPDLPPVYVDDGRVVQILTNLLSNASKYTPAGGTITLTAYIHSATLLEVAVSDTGIGLLPEEQQWVFERYFRSRDADAQREYGTGLGLSITQALVAAHGGTIWFESTYRQGTTFYFTLPTTQTEAG
jgi:signal transduction histidine kinase